jgi:hypothetical protein
MFATNLLVLQVIRNSYVAWLVAILLPRQINALVNARNFVFLGLKLVAV